MDTKSKVKSQNQNVKLLLSRVSEQFVNSSWSTSVQDSYCHTQIVSLSGSSSRSEALDNDSVSLVQTLQIVMNNSSFSPLLAVASLVSLRWCFHTRKTSLPVYTELAGVAKNFFASLVKPGNHTTWIRILRFRIRARIRKFWIRLPVPQTIMRTSFKVTRPITVGTVSVSYTAC